MFDPTWFGKNLSMLKLGGRNNVVLVVEDNKSSAGSTLVQGSYILHFVLLSFSLYNRIFNYALQKVRP